MLTYFMYGLQMLTSLEPYFGYPNGASHSTHNLFSALWDIFPPNGKLVSIHEIFIGRSTNNIVEYSTMVELLSDSISHGIC